MDISLIYPMLNERGSIAEALSRGRAILASLGGEWEIIVVDGGSDDGSVELAREAAREEPRIRVIEVGPGLGLALRTGFSAARHDVAFYCDSDLPYDLGVLRDALPLLRDADVVAGYRLNRRETALRVVYSVVYNALIRSLFRLQARDVNFSFKLLTRRARAAMSLESRGCFIDAELLIKARNAGLRIAEIGVVYTHRRHGLSKLSSPGTILEMLRELWRQRGELFGPYHAASWRERLHTWYRGLCCPFDELDRWIPREGSVRDVGCGHGMFAHRLAATSPARSVEGWDPDGRKIALARAHLPPLPNLVFSDDASLPGAAAGSFSAVTLIDVLQYLPPEEKDALLRRCREALRLGGVLLVKEIDTSPRWKYLITRAQERFSLRLGLTVLPGGRRTLHFEDAASHWRRLESLGFAVQVEAPRTLFPYPHVVLVGTRIA